MALGAPSAPPSGMPGAKPPMAAAPAAGGAPAPMGKEAPFGNSSATQPTVNAGYEAAAMQKVGVLVKQVQDIMNLVGAGSEMGKKLLKVLNTLVAIAPAGNVSNASERNMLEQSLMKNTQNGQTIAALKQGQAAGGQKPPVAAPPAMGAAA